MLQNFWRRQYTGGDNTREETHPCFTLHHGDPLQERNPFGRVDKASRSGFNKCVPTVARRNGVDLKLSPENIFHSLPALEDFVLALNRQLRVNRSPPAVI